MLRNSWRHHWTLCGGKIAHMGLLSYDCTSLANRLLASFSEFWGTEGTTVLLCREIWDSCPHPGTTHAQEIHIIVQKLHKSKLGPLKFNSRSCLWTLPDWYYHYYWFYCRYVEVSSRVVSCFLGCSCIQMRRTRWARASHSGIGWRYSPRRHPLGRGAGLGGGRCGSGPFSGTPQPHSRAVR